MTRDQPTPDIRLEPAESEAGRACLAAYFRELDARFEGGCAMSADDPAILADMTVPEGWFWLARDAGEPVGCVGLKRLDARTGELKRMWTAPAARGRGVARSLLRAVEAQARLEGFSALVLDTNRALTEAHAFYEREGFVRIARYNDNPYAHRWYEKRLPAEADAP